MTSNTVSISAVSCVQELLSRSCIPPSLNNTVLHIFHCYSQTVNHLLTYGVTNSAQMGGASSSSAQSLGGVSGYNFSPKQKLSLLHPTYLEKVTEVFRLLATVYFRRFEENEAFNVEEFLALLFRYGRV